MPNPRRKDIRDAALGLTVGRYMDYIEKALDAHIDLGRALDEEAKAVLRDVLEALAREDLADKVVFMESGTFPTDEPDEEEDPDEWPDELPPAARKAQSDSDEGKIPPPEEDPNAYSGAIRLPNDPRKPKPELEKLIEELKAQKDEKDAQGDEDVVAED